MPWEPKEFPSEVTETIELGRRLSIIINCPVRLTTWDKPQYECWCNTIFPMWLVKGCMLNHNLQPLIDRHEGRA